MQAYVKAHGTECPVQFLNEYRTENGKTVAEVCVTGHPGVSRFRLLDVPTDEVVIR